MEFIIGADQLDIDDQPMPEVDPKVREGLRRSIIKYGIEYPLVVRQKEDGRYSIIDGRTRFSIGQEILRSVIKFLDKKQKHLLG